MAATSSIDLTAGVGGGIPGVESGSNGFGHAPPYVREPAPESAVARPDPAVPQGSVEGAGPLLTLLEEGTFEERMSRATFSSPGPEHAHDSPRWSGGLPTPAAITAGP